MTMWPSGGLAANPPWVSATSDGSSTFPIRKGERSPGGLGQVGSCTNRGSELRLNKATG